MAGSVVFVAAVVIVGVLVIIAGVTPFLIVPVVIVGIGLLLMGPLAARLRGSAVAQPGAGPSGVPTTRDAAYDPVDEPTERGAP